MGSGLFRVVLLVCCVVGAHSQSFGNDKPKKKLSLNSEPEFNVRHLNKPFKINKLNLVWSKAKQVNRTLTAVAVCYNCFGLI